MITIIIQWITNYFDLKRRAITWFWVYTIYRDFSGRFSFAFVYKPQLINVSHNYLAANVRYVQAWGFIWGLSQSQSQINLMKSLIKPRYEQIRCRVGRKTESNCRVFIVLYILSVWVFGQWVVYKWISHLTRILGMKEMKTHSRYFKTTYKTPTAFDIFLGIN